MSPRQVGPFALEEPLGRGGMGAVYRARDTRDGRVVALKLLDNGDDPEARKRFAREARLASALDHPHIASCREAGEADGRFYIAIDLVEGETLAARLERGPMPVADVVSVGLGVAAGLAAAHAQGVFHRDIKPENVMLERGDPGRARVLDFGLARSAHRLQLSGEALERRDTTLDTEVGRILGTPGYMAPEQARGLAVDARADVFALGVLLYRMATGALPFDGDPVARVLATVRGQPVPPRLRDATIPDALERVILRCLEKDPEARYPGAREVGEALAEVTRVSSRAEVEAAATGGAVPVTSRAPRRALAVLGTAVALAAAWLLLRAQGPADPRAHSRTEQSTEATRPTATPPPSAPPGSPGVVDDPAALRTSGGPAQGTATASPKPAAPTGAPPAAPPRRRESRTTPAARDSLVDPFRPR